MKWTTKARIQNLIAALPGPLAHYVYYRVQRRFGGLRNPTPVKQILAGCRLAEAIQKHRPLQNARVLEVGTGRSLAMPALLWTLGVERTLTVDLNRYLRPEILRSDLAWLRAQRPWLTEQLAPVASDADLTSGRLQRLLSLDLERPPDRVLEEVMELCGIDYLSPGDARALDLAEGSLDVHLSRAVLEHVPPDDLGAILREAARILKRDGLSAHVIDTYDHFQYQDSSISRVNYLRFGEREWDRLAGNRFMYMNRLQASDYLALFAESGLEVLEASGTVDDEALELINSGGLPLDERFSGRTAEDLATIEVLVVARPAPDPA